MLQLPIVWQDKVADLVYQGTKCGVFIKQLAIYQVPGLPQGFPQLHLSEPVIYNRVTSYSVRVSLQLLWILLYSISLFKQTMLPNQQVISIVVLPRTPPKNIRTILHHLFSKDTEQLAFYPEHDVTGNHAIFKMLCSQCLGSTPSVHIVSFRSLGFLSS